jgi:hypothetical protein
MKFTVALVCGFALVLVALVALLSQKSSSSFESRYYHIWEPPEFRENLKQWAEHYPHLLRLTTAQERYGLPTAGGPDDCPFDVEVEQGCLNYILTIQDFLRHPEGSKSSNRLPEVMWSGAVHGLEKVGPTAVVEAAKILLEAATCESYPRMKLKPKADGGDSNAIAWKMELYRAISCRKDLKENGSHGLSQLAALLLYQLPTLWDIFRTYEEKTASIQIVTFLTMFWILQNA